MRYAIALTVTCLLLAPEVVSAQTSFEAVITRDGAPVRSGHQVGAEKVGEVSEGVHTIYGKYGDYYRLRVGGSEVWISKIYVDNSPGAAENYERKKRKETELKRRRVKRMRAKRKRARESRARGFGIQLTRFYFSTNSADGITPKISLRNISTDEGIKYVHFTFRPFNSVGDPIRGTIRGESTVTMKGVGPIPSGEGARYEFENTWYNGTVECIELHKVQVEHMDGSSFIYVNDLEQVVEPNEGINLEGECQTF